MSVHNPDSLNGECRHHWLIEAPDGAESDARCKLCGVERKFRNHADGSGGFLNLAERATVKRAKREEAIVGSIIKQLGGGRTAVRDDAPYEPPIEYSDDGSAQ